MVFPQRYLPGAVVAAVGVDAQQDEQQDGEAPQRRAAIAEERQRDADDGAQADNHADVDGEVEDEVGGDAVGIHAGKGRVVALGQRDDAQNQCQEQHQHGHAADEALFLTYGAVDEVGMLLGHIFEFGLRAVQETFARDAATADGNLALIDVIARTTQVVLDAQGDLDARLLVRL